MECIHTHTHTDRSTILHIPLQWIICVKHHGLRGEEDLCSGPMDMAQIEITHGDWSECAVTASKTSRFKSNKHYRK